MTNSVTQRLSEYVAKMTFADLPANVIDGTKRLILDDIGCAFGGYVTKAGKILTDFALEIGGRGIATIIGSGTKVSCTLASGINAQMANILDFDETWKIGHPGSSIVQAGVAVGEHLGSNGKDVINAIVAGYEISTRIGEGVWHGRGLVTNVRPLSWHVFGPAIVAAKLLNLDPQKINHTMGIAGGIAPMMNIKRLIDRPSNMIKAGNHWWCEAGINAAFLAGRDFKGIPDWLDGERGYWTMVSDSCNWEAMTRGLGKDYHIVSQLQLKPWATCRHLHSGIELVLKIMREERLAPSDIDEVMFKSYALVCSHPYAEPKPLEMWDAFWSVPWGIALAVLGYEPGPDWYAEERFKDPFILNLAQKIKIEPLPEATAAYQERGTQKAIAEVQLKAKGKVYTKRQEGMKGDPEQPLTKTELEIKFRGLASRVVTKNRTEKLIEIINSFEDLDDLKPLTRLFKESTIGGKSRGA